MFSHVARAGGIPAHVTACHPCCQDVLEHDIPSRLYAVPTGWHRHLQQLLRGLQQRGSGDWEAQRRRLQEPTHAHVAPSRSNQQAGSAMSGWRPKLPSLQHGCTSCRTCSGHLSRLQHSLWTLRFDDAHYLPRRMDGTALLQAEDAQLLAQCRKVLAAEEASARSDVTAVSLSQPAAAPLGTQHAPPRGQQAAQLAGGTEHLQFTLPPRDPGATLPVELSEDTRQRRAALILQREAAGSAGPPVAPSEGLTPNGGSVQQQSSAATQQQPPAARKTKPSLYVRHLQVPPADCWHVLCCDATCPIRLSTWRASPVL